MTDFLDIRNKFVSLSSQAVWRQQFSMMPDFFTNCYHKTMIKAYCE